MEYRVLAAIHDELNQGWVWVSNSGLESRSVVKITNKKNNKAIYCECLAIDENYRSIYNKPPREEIDVSKNTITINEWYRRKLGDITTKTVHELEIKAANGLWGKLRANFQHPQNVVRMATWLAIISVVLGVIGVVLGVIGVFPSIKS
jgi:hypothetical protein